ncbi:MAG: glutathione S-transferase [Burkholderiales bacterium]
MLKLCGFAASNYYNKVKLALLEKNIPFSEELVWPSKDEALFKRSPIGKIPFIEDNGGAVSESHVIADYLEDAYPQNPMYPAIALEKAKCRELVKFMELYLEWPARRLYPEAFFGGKVSDDVKSEVLLQLEKGFKGLARLTQFDQPFIMGDKMTHADFAAFVHIPVVGLAMKIIYGRNIYDDIPHAKAYIAKLGERPHFQKVNADRKVNSEMMMARSKK